MEKLIKNPVQVSKFLCVTKFESRTELMLQILPNTGSAILSGPRGRNCVGREYHYDLSLFSGSSASQSLAQGLF